jgi:hypothetical protein
MNIIISNITRYVNVEILIYSNHYLLSGLADGLGAGVALGAGDGAETGTGADTTGAGAGSDTGAGAGAGATGAEGTLVTGEAVVVGLEP